MCSQKQWEKDFLGKIYDKRLKTKDRIKSLYPYTTKDGRYDAAPAGRFNWTCGFWGAIQWLLYEYGNDESFLDSATNCTDDVIEAPTSLVIPEAANREISATVVLKRLLQELQ